MWFVFGVAFGFFFSKVFAWLDKKYFVFSDLLWDFREWRRERAEEKFEEEFSDLPRGEPIPFGEWMKKNGF